jgi:hypothetical protein
MLIYGITHSRIRQLLSVPSSEWREHSLQGENLSADAPFPFRGEFDKIIVWFNKDLR